MKRLSLIFVLFAGLFFVVSTVYGQVSLPLTVAPARQEIALDPGEKTSFTVKLYNQADTPVSGILKVADFLVEDKTGLTRIVEEATQASPKFSASQWVSLPYDRITIAPNDKVIFQATVNVPQNAIPGGRYFAIYFEPGGIVPQAVGSPQEAGSGVSTRLASLVYLRVNGETLEHALVSRLFSPSFLEYGPISVETEILNRGNYHVRPKGVFTLTNMLGGLVAQEKLKEQNIFPDTTRNYTTSIGTKWMAGRYKIDLAAAYGQKGQALTRFIWVWVFPWRVALIVVLALIILILMARNIYRKVVVKETFLEEEIEKEKIEIEKLKEELRKRKE